MLGLLHLASLQDSRHFETFNSQSENSLGSVVACSLVLSYTHVSVFESKDVLISFSTYFPYIVAQTFVTNAKLGSQQ
jgi:hypothetical protein